MIDIHRIIHDFRRIDGCTRFILLANHMKLDGKQLVKRLEESDPEHSCLVVMNTTDQWNLVPKELRNRFRVILWVRRMHTGRNTYLGDPEKILGDNVITLYLNAWWTAEYGVFMKIPSLTCVESDLDCKLAKTQGEAKEPSTGYITGGMLHTLFPDSTIDLIGYTDEVDENYKKPHPLDIEHSILKEMGCTLIPPENV